MMNLAGFLLSMVAPLVVRAIIAAGFSAVVLTGVTTAVNALVSTAQSNWSSLPVAVLQLSSLCGIPEVIGMIFGAYFSVFAAKAAFGFGKYVFKK